MAGIAAEHARSPSWDETNWSAIVQHYDELAARWPSPVVDLNRAVAIGFASGPRAGLAALDPLADEPRLAVSLLPGRPRGLLTAGRRRRGGEDFYEEALMLTSNAVERSHIERQLAALRAG